MDCKYILTAGEKEVTFDDKKSLIKYIRDNKLYDEVGTKKTASMKTEDLANVLRQITFGEHIYSPKELRDFQIKLLDKFVKVEEDAESFYKLGSIVALTKGLGKSFEQIDKIKKNLKDLGVGNGLSDNVPFDVRYLITGDPSYKTSKTEYSHDITANNIRILNEIDALSKTMFLERTPSFTNVVDKVTANLKSNLNDDKVVEIKDYLSAFSQIAAYKQWLKINDKQTSTLRNSLIYDSETNLPNIVDIVKEANEIAPSNTFLQFILPVSTTVKIGNKSQKNINNKDLINTIEGKTRGNLEPDMIATLMDSFSELYQNPKTQYHAKALFDYLIVKDSLLFKNKSFVRMLPTLMFNDMSQATEITTKVMSAKTIDEFKKILKELDSLSIINAKGDYVHYFSKEEKEEYNNIVKEKDVIKMRDKMFKKVFGLDYTELYNQFENIYATDVANQFNLELIRPVGDSKKIIENIQYVKSDDGKSYMHVKLFPDSFSKLEKGSEERKKRFASMLKNLNSAGFNIETSDDGKKTYIDFKKFIRVRGRESYATYELVHVERDGNSYEKRGLTAPGKNVPHGIYAVYAPINTVGSSNTVGYANLGERPTHIELKTNIAKKLEKIKTNPQENYFIQTSESILKPVEKLNIYAGTNENADLSNFANRPFKLGDGVTYPTVEHAYQLEKLQYSNQYNDDQISEIVNEYNKKSPAQVRAFGKTIKGVNIKEWDKDSSWIMKDLIKTSFKQNTKALQRLISTGNAELTHTQDRGKWKTEFPKLLMEVREELRQDKSFPTTEPKIGGLFGGFTQLPYDPSTDMPIDFFTDEQINNEGCE